jgi:hypothetical protein
MPRQRISAPSNIPDTWWPKFWDEPLRPQSTFPTPSNPWPELHADQIGSPSRTLMFLSPNIPFRGLLTKPPLLIYWPLPLTLVQKPLLSRLRSDTPAIGSMLFHHLPYASITRIMNFGCVQYWLGLQIFEEHPRCPVCLSTANHFLGHSCRMWGKCGQNFPAQLFAGCSCLSGTDCRPRASQGSSFPHPGLPQSPCRCLPNPAGKPVVQPP